MNIVVHSLLFITSLAAGPVVQTRDLSKFFNGFNGTMVVLDVSSGVITVHNQPRSTHRFSPFSTFKILNSVVALETGVIPDIDTESGWDTTRYPAEDWWPEQWHGTHTMRTAVKYSVVPFYREAALRIGPERMEGYVRTFRYGNCDISSGADDFWLNGSLAISAMEQVAFLEKFYRNEAGVSDPTIAAVKEILVQEHTAQYTLSAKTGAGTGFDPQHPERALGWYVGYVEKGDTVFFFAMNIEGGSFDEILSPRIGITNAVLKELRIID